MCNNHKLNGNEACSQKGIAERKLEQAFIRAVNQVIGSKETLLDRLFANIYGNMDSIES